MVYDTDPWKFSIVRNEYNQLHFGARFSLCVQAYLFQNFCHYMKTTYTIIKLRLMST
jgi:hypothetical protein